MAEAAARNGLAAAGSAAHDVESEAREEIASFLELGDPGVDFPLLRSRLNQLRRKGARCGGGGDDGDRPVLFPPETQRRISETLWSSASGRRHVFWSVANRACRADDACKQTWGPEEDAAIRSAVGPALLAIFSKQPVVLQRRKAPPAKETKTPAATTPRTNAAKTNAAKWKARAKARSARLEDSEWRAALLKRVVSAMTGAAARDPLYASVYWEGLTRVTVITARDADAGSASAADSDADSDSDAEAARTSAKAAAADARPFTLAFECPPRGAAYGAAAADWNPSREVDGAARLASWSTSRAGHGGGRRVESAYASQVRTLGGMPSRETALGDATDETPLVLTRETWSDAGRTCCQAPMVSPAAAGIIAGWRRERIAAAAASRGACAVGGSGGESGGGGGGVDLEPVLSSVVQVLRTAAALNGALEVSAVDCWLLLAVPGPGGPQLSLPEVESDAAGGRDAVDAVNAFEEKRGAASSSTAAAAAAAVGRVNTHTTAAAAAAAARRRMTTWYFDAVTGGALTAMRVVHRAAATKCDEIGAAIEDAERRLLRERDTADPRLYHAWVLAAGGVIDARLRVARAAAAPDGRERRLLDGLRASGVAAMAARAVWLPVIEGSGAAGKGAFERSLSTAVEAALEASAAAVRRVDALRVALAAAYEAATLSAVKPSDVGRLVLHDSLQPPLNLPPLRRREIAAGATAAGATAAASGGMSVKAPPPGVGLSIPITSRGPSQEDMSQVLSAAPEGAESLLDRCFAAAGKPRPGTLVLPPPSWTPGAVGDEPVPPGFVADLGAGESKQTGEARAAGGSPEEDHGDLGPVSLGGTTVTAVEEPLSLRSMPQTPAMTAAPPGLVPDVHAPEVLPNSPGSSAGEGLSPTRGASPQPEATPMPEVPSPMPEVSSPMPEVSSPMPEVSSPMPEVSSPMLELELDASSPEPESRHESEPEPFVFHFNPMASTGDTEDDESRAPTPEP